MSPSQSSSHHSVEAPRSTGARPSLIPSALPKTNNDTSEAQPQDAATPSNPRFTPFFTLIEDAHTREHHHPTVHYVFADDDTDLITEAACRTLEPPSFSSASITSGTRDLQKTFNNSDVDAVDTDPTKHSALPPRRPGVTERYLLLDISAAGDAVVSAHSLTPDWQVLGVEVCKAPVWEAEAEGTGGGSAGLMLKIEGSEGVLTGDEGTEAEGDIEELVGVFEKRMAELRRLIAIGDGSRDVGF